MAKIRLLKFGATWCGPCKALARAKTLEKFAEKHPDVKLELYDVVDEDDLEEGQELTKDQVATNELSAHYDVQAFPTILFVDSDGELLGELQDAPTMKNLEALYAEVIGE